MIDILGTSVTINIFDIFIVIDTLGMSAIINTFAIINILNTSVMTNTLDIFDMYVVPNMFDIIGKWHAIDISRHAQHYIEYCGIGYTN